MQNLRKSTKYFCKTTKSTKYICEKRCFNYCWQSRCTTCWT